MRRSSGRGFWRWSYCWAGPVGLGSSYTFLFFAFFYSFYFLFLFISSLWHMGKASPCSPRRPPRRRLALQTGSLAVPRLNALRTMLLTDEYQKCGTQSYQKGKLAIKPQLLLNPRQAANYTFTVHLHTPTTAAIAAISSYF